MDARKGRPKSVYKREVESRRARVVQMWESMSGEPYRAAAIAIALGISENTVYNDIRVMGIGRKNKSEPNTAYKVNGELTELGKKLENRNAHIDAMHKEGIPVKDIAKYLGIAGSTVYAVLRRDPGTEEKTLLDAYLTEP